MPISFVRKTLQAAAAMSAASMLSGCNLLVLNPAGDIAARQGHLIVVATVLMLIVIVPVIALTFWFAWRYRAANTRANYKPDWDHSTQLELVIWGVPLLIIIALGAVTWIGTHLLDPYRPLGRIGEGRPVPADVKPLEVQVVALDWKWLFVYPEYGVASVNQMAAPVDRPITFRLTSSSTMNAFYVPALAGMIYTMPAMETKLHAVMNKEGEYEGFSSHYSGEGFSHMRFRFHALSDQGFDRWIAEARKEGKALTRAEYLQLEVPSSREPARLYASVDPGLFDAVVNRCVDTDRLCMDQMMAYDAMGGRGLDGSGALQRPRRGNLAAGPFVRSDLCTVETARAADRMSPVPTAGGLKAP
ncbi:ubiquinol oxidase subunit II [Pseudoxanthomonas mexicana]|uniref:ubiquinol oxidase subunit II n=1 Tax=Pseudoxanthomonas mexicana TaxID=128785 RepID=UPI0022F3A50B|nr:ubiquinol oxidase subunit II [Pseudoxanthomonas mexicana]WBX93789.1 ubiquinol oxidase subunit II [Pseudoxanthomonas mexicana]